MMPGLGVETETRPGIEFELPGEPPETVIVPNPIPVRVWLWVLETVMQETPGERVAESLMDFVALETEQVLARAVRLPVGRVRQTADIDAVLEKVAAQMGGELRDAAPFTGCNLQAAARAFGRKVTMLTGRLSAGGEPPSPSSLRSAEGTGTP